MGVPEREEMIADIVEEFRRCRIPLTVVIDHEHRGVWPTAWKAWNSIRRGATHHCVIQDDAILMKNSPLAIIKAVEARPDSPVGIFAARGIVIDAYRRGDAWCQIQDGIWGLGSVLPVGLIRRWMQWNRETVIKEFPHDDTRLRWFLIEEGIWVWTTVPSLIDHGAPSDSVIGHNNRTRIARVFPGREFDALRLRWDIPDKPLREAHRPGKIRPHERTALYHQRIAAGRKWDGT